MGKIRINGITIEAGDGYLSVNVENDKITVNGKEVKAGSASNVKIEGDVGTLVVTGSVTVSGSVKGSIDAGGSVQCGDVGGGIDAGGSVSAKNVKGEIDAGGSVHVSQS